jgi:hypothetical protein
MHDSASAARPRRPAAGDQDDHQPAEVIALVTSAPRLPEWKCPRCGARKRLRRYQRS